MKKFPLWATIFTLCGVILLCGLGNWQLQRLQWKTALLAEIDSEYAKDPLSFEITAENIAAVPAGKTFVKGFAEGFFRHEDTVILGPRPYEGRPGYHVITPFETLDHHILLVNRGWVPDEAKNSGYSRPEGTIIVTGIARKPDTPGMFTPKNIPERDEWVSLIPGDIARARRLDNLLPYILYTDGNEKRGDYPVPLATAWHPPNNHLGYALFWFTLAGVLIIIYFLRFWNHR